MKRRFGDWVTGTGIALGLVIRAACRRRPPARSLTQRLDMLACGEVPLQAAVTIRWNRYQVPFIEAGSDGDMMTALGVVHAHLRLGQMELMRRLAQGRVAEMIGPLGIEIDRSLRLFDFGRAVPAMLEAMTETERVLASRYVDGINHVLFDGGEKPPEFDLLGLRVEPWTVHDLLTLSRLASADISWLVWRHLLPLRRRLAPGLWRPLWQRLLAAGMPATAGTRNGDPGTRAMAAMLRAGSNAVAVAGDRSRRGAAMIASDPHLPLSLPNAWLIAGMRSPGFHCAGLMMPGLPFPLLGRNRWIAWGGTSLHAQGSDLFDVSAEDAASIHTRDSLVRVRGGRARRLRLRESRYGPVVSDGPLLAAPQALALRWMGHRPSNEFGAMLRVARARDFDSFHAALRDYGVSGANLVFAGADGRVAHVLAAHLPKRPPDEMPQDMVLSPADAGHWRHTVDTTALPVRLDPPDGVVVSANQRPPPGKVAVGHFFAPPDRSARLAALLAATPRLDAGDMCRLQRDVSAPASLRLRDLLLAAAPAVPRRRRVQQVRQVLIDWDGAYQATSPGALAFEVLCAGVARRIGSRHRLRAYQSVWMSLHLLQDDCQRCSPAQLRRVVEAALPMAARRLRRYRHWGALHRMVLRHPLGYLPGYGRIFDAPPFDAEGGNNTVHKSGHALGHGRHRASFGSCARHVSDMADIDANHFVLLGGQDGWPGSANYLDQVALWRRGDYIRVPLGGAEIERTFTHVTVLQPKADRT